VDINGTLKKRVDVQFNRIQRLGGDIQEAHAEIAELAEKLRKIKFNGRTPEEVKMVMDFEHTQVVKFAKVMFEDGSGKLQVVKAFLKSTGLSLRDAKTVCDYLVWNDEEK